MPKAEAMLDKFYKTSGGIDMSSSDFDKIFGDERKIMDCTTCIHTEVCYRKRAVEDAHRHTIDSMIKRKKTVSLEKLYEYLADACIHYQEKGWAPCSQPYLIGKATIDNKNIGGKCL